jgi:hypothetical protein
MIESFRLTALLCKFIPKQLTATIVCCLLPVAIAFTGGTTSRQIAFGSMSTPSIPVQKYPVTRSSGMGLNKNENKFSTTSELGASSLFLDIPDIQTLQAAAAVISSGLSAGVGVSWMMDSAASGFRRRFFVRKQIVEGADASIVPKEYRIKSTNKYQIQAAMTPTTESNTMKTTEELRRIIQERKKKFDLPNLLFPNQRSSSPKSPYAEKVVNTNVNPWSSSSSTNVAASVVPVSPPAPATASFLTQPSSVAYTPSFAPVDSAISGSNYLENIAGRTAATSGIKKKFYGPSKWSPGKASTTAFAGGSPYLATMSAPTYSSPPVSYGLPAEILTTKVSSVSGSTSYLSNMSGPSASTVPTNYGTKKSYSPSKWSPKSSSTPSGSDSFSGGNTYFSRISSSSDSPTYSSAELSNAESVYSNIVTSSTSVSTSSYMENLGGGSVSSSSGSKSYSMSKWSPKSNVVSSGTGMSGYLSNIVPSDASSSYLTSYQSASVDPSPSTSVSTGSYMENLGGGSVSSSSGPKSYSMSKWSPKSNVVSSGSGMSGYLSNIVPSDSSSSHLTSYQSTSVEPSSYETPVAPPASSAVSSGGTYMDHLGGSSSISSTSTSSSSPKSYSMSKWSPKSNAVSSSTGMDGYFSTMHSSDPSPSYSTSYQSASYEPSPSSSYDSQVSHPVAAPVEYSYSSPPSTESVSTGGNYMDQIGGGGVSSTTTGAVKSYTMSKWSPKSSATTSSGTSTVMGGYLSNMSSAPTTPATSMSSYSSSYQTASTSYDEPNYQQQSVSSSLPPPSPATTEATTSSYLSMPAPATGVTVKKWGFKSTSGMTGSGTGYFSALSSSPPSYTTATTTNDNYYSNDVNGQYNGNYENANNGYPTSYSTESAQAYQQQSSTSSHYNDAMSQDSSSNYATVDSGYSAGGGSSYLSSI